MGLMIIQIKLYYKIHHKGQRRNKGNVLFPVFYTMCEVVKNYHYAEFRLVKDKLNTFVINKNKLIINNIKTCN